MNTVSTQRLAVDWGVMTYLVALQDSFATGFAPTPGNSSTYFV
jgi:hypothetical protein